MQRFLLVLEESSTGGLLARGLGEAGLEPELFDNAEDALRACEREAYAGALIDLDARGIECSTGSACSAGVARPSHVLLAMGAANDRARSSLRFSLGHNSTATDVDALVEAIGPVVERARRVGTTTPAATVGTA